MRKICLLFLLVFITVAIAVSQNISYTALYDNTSFDSRAIVTTLPVGSTPGAGSVSATGGATYSIPIAVPPGTNGVAPSVSLEYASQGGGGIAGMGWNISGLSAISRVPRNLYFDGTAAPVELLANDRFALDGARLISKVGTYGSAGSTYGTEVENFATVTAIGSSGGGPLAFEVLSKDGIKMEYGNTADSRFFDEGNTTVMLWRLNKVTNPDGNYLEYVYDNTDRDSRISAIHYTGNANAGLSPYNSIEFSYKIRQDGSFSDIRTFYEAGSAIVSKYLLDMITVKAEGSVTKKLQLGYANDGVNSYLRSVAEFGSDNSQLNPTIFKYGNTPALVTDATAAVPPGNEIQSMLGDFDGDGSMEIMTFTYDHSEAGFDYVNQFKIWKRNILGAYALLATENVPVTSVYMYKNRPIPTTSHPSPSDINGDGRDDIVVLDVQQVPVNGGYARLADIRRYMNNGDVTFTSDTQPSPVINGTPFPRIPSSNNFFYPGDYDGDGITEYVVVLGNDEGSSYKVIYYDNVPGQLNTYSEVTGYTNAVKTGSDWHNAAESQVLDFNGDGKMDLLLMWGSESEIFTFDSSTAARSIYHSYSFPYYSQKLHYGDFNGDGKTDILRVEDDYNSSTAYISTGTGFTSRSLTFEKPWTASPDLLTQHDIIFVGDYNGDGKSDIYYDWGRVFSYPSTEYPDLLDLYHYSGADIYYSQGDKFSYKQVSFYSRIDQNVDPPSGRPYFRDDLVVDMNGDGRSDIVTTNGAYLGIKYINFNGTDNLLEKVKTGTNYETSWQQRSILGDNSLYTTGSVFSTYPLNTFTPNVKVVSSFSLPDGRGSSSITNYNYEGARVHRSGKGFLGFGKVTASNVELGIKSVSENEFNETYYVALPKENATLLTDNSLISKTTLTNGFVPAAEAKRFWIKTTDISENRALEGGTITTSNVYDLNGNITSSASSTGVETTVTSSLYGTYPGYAPAPNKPTSVTLTRTRNGESSFSTTTAYGYNGNGQLTSKTDFHGKDKAVTTTYGYNNKGNLETTTVGSPGLTNRTASAGFDGKGRYAESTTDVLGYSSSVTYDNKWGTPVSVTGVDGLVTTHSYDAFGRKTSTDVTGDYTVSTSLSWDISGNQVWKALTSYSQSGRAAGTEWFDILGRSIRTETAAFGSGTIESNTAYDSKGNVSSIEQPHKLGESFTTTTSTYDSYNRLSNMNAGPLGLSTYGYLYSGGNTTISVSTPSGTTYKTTDLSGKIVSANDTGGTLTYTYYSHGGVKEVKNGGITLTANLYDEYGRQEKLTDANAGATEYRYNAFGELTWQKSAKNDEHTMNYDAAGRITSRTGPEGTTSYEYYGGDEYGGKSRGKLKKVIGFEPGNSTEYRYNDRARVNWMNERLDNQDHATTYNHNIFGDVTQINYPSGFVEKQTYDGNGYLTTIKNGTDHTLYGTTAMNGQGQVTSYNLGNGKSSGIEYQNGMPTRYLTDGIQDLRMEWDYGKGNLTKRSDIIKSKEESFVYDNLDRLTSANISGGVSFSATYAANGNINSKTDAGTYSYHGTKFNAVTGATNPTTAIPSTQQDITYTPFQQPSTVNEGVYNLTYTYGADYNRIKSELKQNNITIQVRYYFSGFEKDGAGRYIYYVNSPVGLIAIVEGSNTHYTYTDHLGSIVAATNGSGGIDAEMNFDAWGRRRDPNNWTLLAPTASTELPDWLYRGYTGHEHLDQFGLINMNGRLFDPVLGRVLSPDNYVQNVYGTQDYNRYSYAHNNPLVYTDPDGNNPVFVIAALIGGGLNLWNNWSKIKDWKQGLSYFVSGAIGGAVSVVNPYAGGAITAGGNLAIDIVTGNIPDLNSPWKVAKYTGGLALDGISVGGAGKLAGWGYSKAVALFSTETSVAIAGEGAKTIQRFVVNSIDDIAFASQATYEWVVKGTVKGGLKTLWAAAAKTGGKELYNFGKTAAQHMTQPGRKVPLQILDDVIKNTKGLPDPGGSGALMHYSPMWRNGKLYNLEVLFDKASNSIWHFKYSPIKP